jgi:hypothetical protein
MPSTFPHPTMALELARSVQKLPRELRDMVYSHLWDGDTMKELNYSSRLLPAGPPHDTNSNSIIHLC